ncbi:helix-turn-helix domain-containing protein [Patescibacteria group bacterium]
MTRVRDRRKVIELRKRGKTYSDIRRELKIPKSTLSGWLSGYPLTKKQIKKLQDNIENKKDIATEKFRETMSQKRRYRLTNVIREEQKNLPCLNKRELYLCGLFLYLGEGTKGLRNSVCLCNTNPKVILFYYYWLINVVGVSRERLRVLVHLYEDMDVEKTLHYWSKLLNIPRRQFVKPYIKRTYREDIDHKGHGYGTCNLYISDQHLKEKIILGLEVILNYYGGKKEPDFVIIDQVEGR